MQKTKILKVEIKNSEDGDFIEIKTNRKDDYKYIWLYASDLPELADVAAHLG